MEHAPVFQLYVYVMGSILYSAYGLSIQSDTLLPNFRSASPQNPNPDVYFFFNSIYRPPVPFPLDETECWQPHTEFVDKRVYGEEQETLLQILLAKDQQTICMDYGSGLQFIFSADGRRIWAKWTHLWSLEQVIPYVFSSVMGFALRLQGHLCLHTSAVIVDEQAVLFCGFSGSGKSTTSAWFAANGHPVVTDDIGVIEQHGSTFWIRPGYPQLRLFSWSAAAIGEDANALPPLSSDRIKRLLDVQDSRYTFADASMPIRAIYILSHRSEQDSGIVPLAFSDGLIQLTKHTYLQYLLSSRMRAADFPILGQLARAVPVRSLVTPIGLKYLPDLYSMIMTDLAAFTPTP